MPTHTRLVRTLLAALTLCALFTPFSSPQAQRHATAGKISAQKMLNPLAAAYTQEAYTQRELYAGDMFSHNHFGSAVAVSADGNTALVGARFADISGGTDAGWAYIFTRNGSGFWSRQIRLQASDAAANAFFGNSVALSADGNTALIGAPGDDNSVGANHGSVYVFARDSADCASWTQQTRIQVQIGGGASNDAFGNAVALNSDGSTAVVGAARADWNGRMDSGMAVAHKRNDASWADPLQ